MIVTYGFLKSSIFYKEKYKLRILQLEQYRCIAVMSHDRLNEAMDTFCAKALHKFLMKSAFF